MSRVSISRWMTVWCAFGFTLSAHASMLVVDSANHLAEVDLATGQVNVIGTTQAQFTDIAFAPDGRLFGITSSYLYEINPTNAWSTLIGDHGFGNPALAAGLDSLAFDPDGTLYAAGNNILISIDPATATGTRIGDLSGLRSAGDLAVDGAGQLVMSTDLGQLARVFRDGSGASAIGALPFTDVYALATDAAGALVGVRSTNEILSIDSDTGFASVVGPLQAEALFGRVWGAAIPFTNIPEPTTLLFALAGGACLVRRRHLRNAHRPHRSIARIAPTTAPCRRPLLNVHRPV